MSLRDGDARPIAKDRLGRPVEFGWTGQVVDNDDGVVLDHALERGNPADAPHLAPAVGRVIRRTGRRPRTVTADRGSGEAGVEKDLHDLGVRAVVIPRRGRPGKARHSPEHRRAFRRTVKWRTGGEARISAFMRQYGWDRTRLDHLEVRKRRGSVVEMTGVVRSGDGAAYLALHVEAAYVASTRGRGTTEL